MTKLTTDGGEKPKRRMKLPPEKKRRNKTMPLAPETIAILDHLREESCDSYGVIVDRAIAIVYGDAFDEPAPDPARAQISPARKPTSAPPDEFAEYCRMRGFSTVESLRRSARGKELVELYEARYQRG